MTVVNDCTPDMDVVDVTGIGGVGMSGLRDGVLLVVGD